LGVPELSRFFGIIIRMFVETGESHHRVHFHAYYQDDAATFAVDTIECLAGSLSTAQRRLVEAWAVGSGNSGASIPEILAPFPERLAS
jgi:hypothetical protein